MSVHRRTVDCTRRPDVIRVETVNWSREFLLKTVANIGVN